jgi:cell wall-associated NlpC family hydrolase
MSEPRRERGPMPSSARPVRTRLRSLVVTSVVLVVSLGLLAPPADAMSRHTRDRVLHIAASKKGAPYRYGATGPQAFDCSGYTRWVLRKVGRRLPRTSRSQYRATRHVTRAHRRRGDLVFFKSHGRVYHVAIYAGRNRIWHAPRTGERVHRERLWTRQVSYGRIR